MCRDTASLPIAFCGTSGFRPPRKRCSWPRSALIISPIDFPAWIPVLGELDMLALGILAVETFVEACPEDVRREHEAAIKAKESIFDRDVRDTVAAARYGAGRLANRVALSTATQG